MTDCARCGKPVPDGRRRYCSEACADVVAHQRRLERLSRGQPKLAKYRIYDYRGPNGSGGPPTTPVREET